MQAHEDLATIRRMMEDSQRVIVDNGKHFILWGAITAVGLVATWLVATGALAFPPGWLWVALIAAGWAGSVAIGIGERRRGRVRTAGPRLLGTLWVSCGATLTLVGLAGIFGAVVPVQALPGVLATILGLGFAVTGGATGMGAMRYLAALWWLGGAWMLFVPGLYTLLLLAAMAVLLEVVPGIALYRRSRARGVAQPAA